MITVEVEGKVGMALASFDIDQDADEDKETNLIITPLAIVPENELWDKTIPITNSEDSSFSFHDLPSEVRDMIKEKEDKKKRNPRKSYGSKNFKPPMKGSFDEFGMES